MPCRVWLWSCNTWSRRAVLAWPSRLSRSTATTRMVINAAPGLGVAVVSGIVQPEQYTLAKAPDLRLLGLVSFTPAVHRSCRWRLCSSSARSANALKLSVAVRKTLSGPGMALRAGLSRVGLFHTQEMPASTTLRMSGAMRISKTSSQV